jgi:methylated-DNA-[protein]-cysteine S-methyltransferase
MTDDPAGAASALDRYFGGDLRALDALAVDTGGTPFQQRVWIALRAIPVGTAVSYSALARTIGMPRAVRAVAAANGANPVAIVIPCHRVIGADGSLTGYGGGLARKRWLLAHEGAPLDESGTPQGRLDFR